MSTFISWSEEQVEKRKKMKPAEPDVMSYILDSPSTRFNTPAEEQNWLVGDSRLIVVAGSDTITTALAFACYYLAKNPSQVEKPRIELENAGYQANPSNLSILQSLNHLNGIINETLRLHPPIPCGVYQLSPPEGFHIQ
jgi:cytochrome P450